MTLELGTTDINKIYLGGTEIKKAQLGSTTVYQAGTPTPTEGWAQTSAGIEGLINAQSCSAKLNATQVCIMNQSTELLEVYDVATLTQVGTGQVVTGSFTNDNWISYLADNEVIVSYNGTVYQKYVWDSGAETWSTDGGTINLGVDTMCVGASSTRFFAFRRSGSAGVSCYDLSGGSWTQTGSTKAYTTTTRRQALAILDRTNNAEVMVCYTYQTAGDSQNEIHAISFNGTAFSDIDTISVGTGTDSFPTMTRLTDSTFAFFGNITEALEHWTLSGGTLSMDSSLDLSASENGAFICDYEDNEIMLNSTGASNFALQFWTYTPPA